MRSHSWAFLFSLVQVQSCLLAQIIFERACSTTIPCQGYKVSVGCQGWACSDVFLLPHPGFSPACRTSDANLLLTLWLHLEPEERNVSLLLRSRLEELLSTSAGVEKLQLVSLFVEGGCFTFIYLFFLG